MSDVIWALDQRDRCIACPAAPVANAVVLHLAADGRLDRVGVQAWAVAGVMAAGVTWPGMDAELTEDDWLDLEDAATGLAGLAQQVAVFGTTGLGDVVRALAARTGVELTGVGDTERLLDALRESAPA